MDFDEILALPDKATVPELRGRIIKVYDPKNPTPGQDRAGIHPQTLVIQDDAGTNLDLYLMRKESHFLPSEVGEIYHFRCTPGERDGADLGLAMNRWKGDTHEMVCVQVDKQARFYRVEQAPAERKAYEDNKPVVGDLITFYAHIITSVEERLHGTEVGAAFLSHPECLTSAAVTIFIEGCKQGMWHKPKTTPAPAAYKGVDFAKANRENAEKLEGQAHLDAAKSNTTPAGASNAELALMITSGFKSDAIKAVFDDQPAKPNYAAIYDEIVIQLRSEGYEDREINAAHDRVRGLLKKKVERLTDGQLYKSICCNFDRFREQLPKLQQQTTEDPQAGDDHGLPSLDD